uniref:Tyrosine-protein kinase n=1 Tax=Caenorhabditis tropicalis TaxID=1561998 RepID=A0A1I7U4R7_9PELO
MGSREIGGSRELFTKSAYFDAATKRDTSLAPKSMPATSVPGQLSSTATTPTERGTEKEKEEKTGAVNDRGREKPETTQQATENSQALKAPDGVGERKKKKKKRLRVNNNSMAEEKTSNIPEREDFQVFEKKLREFNFYHGFLPREDLSSTLHNPGDYLIRVSEVAENEQKLTREVILSLIPVTVESKNEEDKNRPRNVVIKRVSNMLFCETTRTFESINDLIQFYTKNTGACSQGTFQLKTPILQQPWEFMHSDVQVGKVLGEGAFGKVCAGQLKLKDGTNVEVAIKMTKVSAFLSKAKIKEMMNEARFIRNFNHKNVVRLYGVAHDEQPLYILLELVKGGSLLDHLKKAKEKGAAVSVLEKIRHCSGAGKGIEYLHQNHCIHRDIAARNCLLSENVVKITDFGLSRTGPSYKIKGSCKLPVKWLAPETLSTFMFSYATDVYSWGITCYEVFADGVEPFDGVSNAVVKSNVLSSKFLEMPSTTPEAIKKFLNTFIFVDASRRSQMGMAVAEFERMAVMCENGQLEMGGGAKQKLMKVFKKRHEKQSKGD